VKKCDWCGKEIPFSKLKVKGKFYCSEECVEEAGEHILR
jgi:hypothetical protein